MSKYASVGIMLWLNVPVEDVGDKWDQIHAASDLVQPFVNMGAKIGPATVDEYEWHFDHAEVFDDD